MLLSYPLLYNMAVERRISKRVTKHCYLVETR